MGAKPPIGVFVHVYMSTFTNTKKYIEKTMNSKSCVFGKNSYYNLLIRPCL